MRAAPAFEVSLHRFGLWRSAVAAVCLLGVAAVAAWLVARPLASAASWAAVGAGLIGLALCAVSLLRVAPAVLGWDGSGWWLRRGSGDTVTGTLQVNIDLGAWMLLRFEPVSSGGRRRAVWLPVQRHGLEAQWHALRCAVHAKRTVAAGAGPVEP